MGDMVVVTGGRDNRQNEVLSRVVVYNTDGEVAKLHGFSTTDISLDLNTARMLHACGHYFKEDEVVTIFI